jgi:hypothetical protein
MSARPQHLADGTPQPTAIDIFKARCWARAELYAAAELDLHEAVDVLQEAAVKSGLVAEIGQDAAQTIMSDAFAEVRAAEAVIEPEPIASPDALAAWDAPGWQQAIAKYHQDRDRRVSVVEVEPETIAHVYRIIGAKAFPEARLRWTAESTLDAAAWLAFKVMDAERWRAWLEQRSATERADVVEHLTIKQRRRAA